MTHSTTEVLTGGLVLAVAAGFAFYAAQAAGLSRGGDSYPLSASFRSLEGVSVGTDVRLAGVKIGTVTNVAAFGAFVDIGVHQDGLVHVSQLADRFVKDPHEVVKTGQVVKVTVTEVDVPRKRIGLTMKKDGGASAKEDRNARGPAKGAAPRRGGKPGGHQGSGKGKTPAGPKGGKPGSGQGSSQGTGALGAALMDAFKKK